jgi:IclR family transcriptional regulator, KDG regulon repressor
MTNRKNISAVERAMKILELFLDGSESLSVPNFVSLLNLPRSTTHELVRTLVDLGYLFPDKNNPRKFSLGLKIFELGGAYASNLDFVREGQDIVKAIAAKCGETVNLAVLQNKSVIFIMKVDSIHPVRLFSAVGRRIPAHVTALGKMLLSALPDREVQSRYENAEELETMTPFSITSMTQLLKELAKVRESGIAFDDSESTPDVQCMAAPVYNHNGEMIAAMSVSVLTTRINPERRKELTKLICEGAAELSSRLGYYHSFRSKIKPAVLEDFSAKKSKVA